MAEDDRKLFVGKLPQDIHEDEIRMIFNTYGNTTDVHLMDQGRQQPGQDRCAFVTFDSAESAKVAMQVLNGVYKFREDARDPINVGIAVRRGKGGGKDKGPGGPGSYDRMPPPGYDRGPPGYDRGFGGGKGYGGPMGGKGGFDPRFDRGPPPMDRGYGGPPRGYDRGPPPRDFDGKGGRKGNAPPGCKLYVGNLPGDIQRDAIDMVFSNYGQISDIHIMNGRAKNGQSCAFVIYSNPSEAKTAIAAISTGYEIRPGDGNIFVKYADEGGRKGGPMDRPRPY